MPDVGVTPLGRFRDLLVEAVRAATPGSSARRSTDREAEAMRAENTVLRTRVEVLSEAQDEAAHALKAFRRRLSAVSRLALVDELTGLPNRRALDREIERELARSTRHERDVSVVMVDIDQFKDFNDGHGHPAGDALLREVSAAWLSQLRGTDFMARDGLIARYGGDEFIAVLPECGEDQAATVVARLRAAMPDGQHCSAGIACWDRSESPAELLARADAALYAAKAAGRDRAVVSAGIPGQQ